MIGKEVKVSLVPYAVKCICDRCNEGYINYIQGSDVVSTNPPMYLHQCDKCGEIKLAYRQYPVVMYDEIEPMKAVLDSEIIDDISE